MKTVLTTLLAVLAFSCGFADETRVGTVTVSPIAKNGSWKGNDTGADVNSVFMVTIDKLGPVKVSQKQGAVFRNLALDDKHLVDIHLDGKRLTSFYFSFKSYKGVKHLLLWYKTMYGTWSLSVNRRPPAETKTKRVRSKPKNVARSGKGREDTAQVGRSGKGAGAIVDAARKQIGKTLTYDPAYVRLSYPGGDVPIEKGVCTDVVIRAFRDALKLDLQRLVHEDMKKAFSRYPQHWGLKKPDWNIDHRRVPNLKTYFKRRGYSLEVTKDKADYQPGDLVTCMVGRNLPHIMIVSDRKNSQGVPLVIHNIGRGAREEDRLFEFTIDGHYRFQVKP